MKKILILLFLIISIPVYSIFPPLWETCRHIVKEKEHKTFKITTQMYGHIHDQYMGPLPLDVKYNLRFNLYVVPGIVKIYWGEIVPSLYNPRPQSIYIGTRFLSCLFEKKPRILHDL